MAIITPQTTIRPIGRHFDRNWVLAVIPEWETIEFMAPADPDANFVLSQTIDGTWSLDIYGGRGENVYEIHAGEYPAPIDAMFAVYLRERILTKHEALIAEALDNMRDEGDL